MGIGLELREIAGDAGEEVVESGEKGRWKFHDVKDVIVIDS